VAYPKGLILLRLETIETWWNGQKNEKLDISGNITGLSMEFPKIVENYPARRGIG